MAALRNASYEFDPFYELLNDVAMDMTESHTKDMMRRCVSVIPGRTLESIEHPFDLFRTLHDQGNITRDNTLFLEKALEAIALKKLAQKLQKYHEKGKTEVVESPSRPFEESGRHALCQETDDRGTRESVEIHQQSQVATAVEETQSASHMTTDIVIDKEENGDIFVDEIVKETVTYCEEKNISNPVEILRYFQSKVMIGRPLEVENINEYSEGDTSYIIVDRFNLLETALDEVSILSSRDLRKTLEVDFYGEKAKDYGGPRKEFFTNVLQEIKVKYFDHGLREHLADDYSTVGVVMCLSIFQNGKIPRFMSDGVRHELLISSDPSPCIIKLREGLSKIGIYQLSKSIPAFASLLQPNPSSAMTFRKLRSLLTPSFSEDGSNSRRLEGAVYGVFLKYLRDVASGRRDSISLSDVLQFVTGADEEPVLGFSIAPSIEFVDVTSTFIPTANTCINCLSLPRATLNIPLLSSDKMFQLYDTAFSKKFFGNI
ncbi:uncharacterized protein LOC144345437 [Saccoglossus kowalevskii]